ncbi:MAG: hypothetical protein QXY65_06680 [Candidatus Methanomethylicaceae archaeon]
MSEFVGCYLSGELLEKFRKIMDSKNISNKSDALKYSIAIAYDYLFNKMPLMEEVYKKLERKLENLDLKLSEGELRQIVEAHIKLHYTKNLIAIYEKRRKELEDEILNLKSEIDYQKLLREINEWIKLLKEFYDTFKDEVIQKIIDEAQKIIEKLEGIEASKHIIIKTRSKNRKLV